MQPGFIFDGDAFTALRRDDDPKPDVPSIDDPHTLVDQDNQAPQGEDVVNEVAQEISEPTSVSDLRDQMTGEAPEVRYSAHSPVSLYSFLQLQRSTPSPSPPSSAAKPEKDSHKRARREEPSNANTASSSRRPAKKAKASA